MSDALDFVTPFIGRVPKDPVENLRWRRKMRELALYDLQLREALRDAAMQDVLFWFNAFGWLIEPRAAVKVVPFCTWSHQDPVTLAMDQAITDAELTGESIDVVLDKSRAQGGTYLYLGIFLRRWLRDPMFSAGLVTRNEDLVDSATDADTLMWKVMWAIERLPFWMRPKGWDPKRHRSLSDHSIINPELESTIVGYAAGQDVGRGGRKSAFAADEIGAKDFIKGGKDEAVMESLADVTNCVFLVSTFGADAGVFYQAATDPDSGGLHLVLDWKDNPVQNRLSYITRNGITAAINPAEQEAVNAYLKANPDKLKKLARRGYKMENQQRSPWYDGRCLRPIATPRLIAKELDRNPKGAVGKVFDTEVLDRMKKFSCRPPVWQGKITFSVDTLEVTGLIRQDNGPLKLWFDPGMEKCPPRSLYALGCDISAGGSGAMSSNSTCEGIDRMTGEQVLDFAIMGMPAIRFARYVVALAKWFYDAYLGWEASGIAVGFAKEVLEAIGYADVYYRDVEEIGSRAKTRKAGWWNGCDDDKADLFEKVNLAMEEGHCIPRSEDMIMECGEYEWEGGKIVHRPSKKSKMDGRSHGDRCVGFGVAWLMCDDRPVESLDGEEEPAQKAPIGSIAWCDEQEEKERRAFGDDDPQLELRDLLRLTG